MADDANAAKRTTVLVVPIMNVLYIRHNRTYVRTVPFVQQRTILQYNYQLR